MKTNGDILREHGQRLGIPARTLDQVREAITEAKATNADVSMTRLMLHHGRITDEARGWLEQEYPQ